MSIRERTLFIGICGGSGSGKSHFLEKVKEHYSNEELCLISQDDYYKPIEDQIKDENGKINFDLPTSFNEALLFEHVTELLSGKTISKEKYNFNNPAIKPCILTYKPSPITILEGIFIFHYHRIASLFDIKLFIDTDEQISLSRRISRDGPERAISTEEVVYQWKNHVMPSYHQYSLPYRKNADLVIENSEAPLDILPLVNRIEAWNRK